MRFQCPKIALPQLACVCLCPQKPTQLIGIFYHEALALLPPSPFVLFAGMISLSAAIEEGLRKNLCVLVVDLISIYAVTSGRSGSTASSDITSITEG